MRILVTGGAGFIGINLVHHLITRGHEVANVDKLVAPGSKHTVATVAGNARHHFFTADLCDGEALRKIFIDFRPQAVMHLAAQTHVDRSIDNPGEFVYTNLVGTYQLLEAARAFVSDHYTSREPFRIVHVSTDEVYGTLTMNDRPFRETDRYLPNSPYAASKAGADHLARAWYVTYGLPVIITNCSNNYGPWQFPDKLIPLLITKAMADEPLPIYGDGSNRRDWLHVSDHVRALCAVLASGTPGQSYNIGGGYETSNLELATELCRELDRVRPEGAPHQRLITFVPDRPGHDLRYAIDSSHIAAELGWRPRMAFSEGLRRTIQWYREHQEWVRNVMQGSYAGERLGAPSQ